MIFDVYGGQRDRSFFSLLLMFWSAKPSPSLYSLS
jgi:hypothetical protein